MTTTCCPTAAAAAADREAAKIAYYAGPYQTGGAYAEDVKAVRSFVKAARKSSALAKAYVAAAYAEAEAAGVDPVVVMSNPLSACNALPRCAVLSKTRKYRAYEASTRIAYVVNPGSHARTVDDLAALVGL